MVYKQRRKGTKLFYICLSEYKKKTFLHCFIDNSKATKENRLTNRTEIFIEMFRFTYSHVDMHT